MIIGPIKGIHNSHAFGIWPLYSRHLTLCTSFAQLFALKRTKIWNRIGDARPLYSGFARPFRPSHTAPRGGFAKQTESAALLAAPCGVSNHLAYVHELHSCFLYDFSHTRGGLRSPIAQNHPKRCTVHHFLGPHAVLPAPRRFVRVRQSYAPRATDPAPGGSKSQKINLFSRLFFGVVF